MSPAQHLPQEGLLDTVEWNVARVWKRPRSQFSLSWAGQCTPGQGPRDPEATLGAGQGKL